MLCYLKMILLCVKISHGMSLQKWMIVLSGFTVVCEMCGTTGNMSTFFSKTKRFCSTSCSRSYSSNSKKSSILARLQVRKDVLRHRNEMEYFSASFRYFWLIVHDT